MMEIFRKDILQGVVVKRKVKDVYQKIFKTQIEILARVGVDDKKAAQLMKELNADLERQKLKVEFEKILLAMDFYEIETWTKEICAIKAEADKQERAI